MDAIGPHNLRRSQAAEVAVPDGQVRILESHHAQGFEMASDRWPFHKICWVALGSGQLEFSEQRTHIQRDDFLVLPANWDHRFIDSKAEPLTLVMFCLDQVLTDPGAALSKIWQQVCASIPLGRAGCGRSAFHRNEFIEYFRRGLTEQSASLLGWELELFGLAQALLIRMARGYWIERARAEPDSVTAVRGVIDYLDRYFYRPQRIDELAQTCNLSTRRFTTLFKQESGRTVTDYMNHRRIEYAQTRLKQTGHILYACYESGFDDVSYFYRVFKKYTGQTPGQCLDRT